MEGTTPTAYPRAIRRRLRVEFRELTLNERLVAHYVSTRRGQVSTPDFRPFRCRFLGVDKSMSVLREASNGWVNGFVFDLPVVG